MLNPSFKMRDIKRLEKARLNFTKFPENKDDYGKNSKRTVRRTTRLT